MIKMIILIFAILSLNSCKIEITEDDFYSIFNDDRDCESPSYIKKVMLERVNKARTQGRYCGRQNFYPAQPLSWDNRLADAAYFHADDMAKYRLVAHTGSGGDSVEIRVRRTGYSWSYLSENISVGKQSPDNMVEFWLNDTDDCTHIMDPHYTEMGVACANWEVSNQNDFYWTLVLATPL
ncbi:MAG: hypothetical protein BWK79_12620 [Beggiatoa sp. IS2]|nr:MAG: hypothetical protein BWK79_12620 [Beggiatoa sp. IS2]